MEDIFIQLSGKKKKNGKYDSCSHRTGLGLNWETLDNFLFVTVKVYCDIILLN